MKKITWVGPLLIASAATLWAFDGVLRRNLYELDPLIIVFFEHLIGSILLIPVLLRYRKHITLSRPDALTVMVVSLLSGLLGTLWFTSALLKIEFIPFSVVILLQKLQPVFAMTAAAIVLKETLSKKYIGWAALALVSAFFVTFPNGNMNLDTGSQTVYAALLAVGAAAAWGSSTALSRKLLINNPAGAMTALRFMYTTLFAGIWMLSSGKMALLASPSYSQIQQLFIIAFSTGMAALYIYYAGLKRTQAKVSTIVELIFPLLAVFIDIFLYKTTLLPTQYAATALLLFAIYRVSLLNRAATK